MLETRHPVALISKNSLVLRDLDILSELAKLNLVRVFMSVTTLDNDLARIMEPRASAPHRRLQTIARLHAAGVPVGAMVAPLIPFVNDNEMEQILKAVADAGAGQAGYVFIRLAHELKELFRDWLQQHMPLKAERVMAAIQDARGGRDNDPRFGRRMRGEGVFAELLSRRFQVACTKYGLNRQQPLLRTDLFRPPKLDGQLDLF
jgi:DNA repair photolyase